MSGRPRGVYVIIKIMIHWRRQIWLEISENGVWVRVLSSVPNKQINLIEAQMQNFSLQLAKANSLRLFPNPFGKIREGKFGL